MAFLDNLLRGSGVAPSSNRIIQGLKLAALFSERPENRFDRLQLSQRRRESDSRIADREERTSLARARDSREDKRASRREEREDLATRLNLAQISGDQPKLTPFEFGGETFDIPNERFNENADLEQRLEQDKQIRELRKFPLPGPLGQVFDLEPDTPISPDEFDRRMRGAEFLERRDRKPSPASETFTDENGIRWRVNIDPKNGRELSRTKLGKVRTPASASGASQSRLRSNDARRQQIIETASRISIENNGNPAQAIADLARQARFDDFLKKNFTAIRKELIGSKERGGAVSTVERGRRAVNGLPGGESTTSPGTSPDAAAEFEAFLKARGGG